MESCTRLHTAMHLRIYEQRTSRHRGERERERELAGRIMLMADAMLDPRCEPCSDRLSEPSSLARPRNSFATPPNIFLPPRPWFILRYYRCVSVPPSSRIHHAPFGMRRRNGGWPRNGRCLSLSLSLSRLIDRHRARWRFHDLIPPDSRSFSSSPLCGESNFSPPQRDISLLINSWGSACQLFS